VEKEKEPVGASCKHVDNWASSPPIDISTHQGTKKKVFKLSWNMFMKSCPRENPSP